VLAHSRHTHRIFVILSRRESNTTVIGLRKNTILYFGGFGGEKVQRKYKNFRKSFSGVILTVPMPQDDK
jgi:hypothetical protein